MEVDPKFDYVIVGGGSAGCVLASLLTENPDLSACLLYQTQQLKLRPGTSS